MSLKKMLPVRILDVQRFMMSQDFIALILFRYSDDLYGKEDLGSDQDTNLSINILPDIKYNSEDTSDKL
jgi:hypothetical protein